MDKQAWDRNYGCRFIKGGTAAVSLAALYHAQAAGMSEGTGIKITESGLDELLRVDALAEFERGRLVGIDILGTVIRFRGRRGELWEADPDDQGWHRHPSTCAIG